MLLRRCCSSLGLWVVYASVTPVTHMEKSAMLTKGVDLKRIEELLRK